MVNQLSISQQYVVDLTQTAPTADLMLGFHIVAAGYFVDFVVVKQFRVFFDYTRKTSLGHVSEAGMEI
jgi:uncharacterized protein YybS (DUF2232 family)